MSDKSASSNAAFMLPLLSSVWLYFFVGGEGKNGMALTLQAVLMYALVQMERLLQEMQSELDNLSWDNDKLAAHLRVAIKEHLIESMLAEIEEEHDKAIYKIEFLEQEVIDFYLLKAAFVC